MSKEFAAGAVIYSSYLLASSGHGKMTMMPPSVLAVESGGFAVKCGGRLGVLALAAAIATPKTFDRLPSG
jgi:hypothetical protein